ncbi:MAG: hypothetical protein SNG35_05975 [Rikenellaceae bacterium]
MQRYEKLYEESIQLIDRSPDLKTNAIPEHLLIAWIYNGHIVPNPSAEMLFAASIFNYANNKYGDPTLEPMYERQRFERMQQALATEYVCRQVGAKLRPRKIFDFKRDNEPINVDLKRNQLKKFNDLAVTFIPLRLGNNR